jgi:hypothetical protein
LSLCDGAQQSLLGRSQEEKIGESSGPWNEELMACATAASCLGDSDGLPRRTANLNSILPLLLLAKSSRFRGFFRRLRAGNLRQIILEKACYRVMKKEQLQYMSQLFQSEKYHHSFNLRSLI